MSLTSVPVRVLFAATVFWGLSAGAARAEYIGSDLVWVTMEDSQGRSARAGIANPFANLPPQANVPQHVREMISDRFAVESDGEVLGWVDSLLVELDGDPMAHIAFSLTAGGSDVTVTVSSATVAFPELSNPFASAEAEVTLTDNGGGDATIETLMGNDGLFQAIFNTSSEYAELLGDGSVGGGSVTFSENTSGPIAGSVSSIQARFAFRLSTGDSAEGSGVFTVVPEPTSAMMMVAAGLALLGVRARRRHV